MIWGGKTDLSKVVITRWMLLLGKTETNFLGFKESNLNFLHEWWEIILFNKKGAAHRNTLLPPQQSTDSAVPKLIDFCQ